MCECDVLAALVAVGCDRFLKSRGFKFKWVCMCELGLGWTEGARGGGGGVVFRIYTAVRGLW